MRRTQHQTYRRVGHRILAVLTLIGGLLFVLGYSVGRMTAAPARHSAPRVKRVSQAKPAKQRSEARQHVNAATASPVVRAIDPTIQKGLTNQLHGIHFSGTAIIIKNGRLVASSSMGMASVKRHLANREDTLYEIDSLQKSLTAGIVMQLLDAGKLKLTTPIAAYYPQFKSYPQLTVDSLLKMHSGLKANGSLAPQYQSDAQLLNTVANRLTFLPAEFGTWRYTPANYVLLAGIAEKITGHSYDELFKQAYIARLKLKQTVMAYALRPTENYASGYMARGGNAYAEQMLTSVDKTHAELGTGQVYMSALDFYEAVRSLVSGSLLTSSRAQVYHSGQLYDGGFYQDVPGFLRANGSGYGYLTTMTLSLDGRNAVIILSNVQGQGRPSIVQLGAQLRKDYL